MPFQGPSTPRRALAPLAVVLLAAAALAGCVGGGEEAGPETQAPSSPGTPGADPTPAAAPKGDGKTSPTPSSSSATAANESGNATVAPHTTTVEGTASVLARVAIPCPDGSGFHCSVGPVGDFAALDLAEGSPRKATLVATWEAKTPLAASLNVYFYPAEENAIASGSGPSPLTVEIPVEGLAAGGYLAGAFPAFPGAMVDQEVHMVLTLEYG